MNATNKTLSIIAFYLSEYDMDAVSALGLKTRTEAINTISSDIGNGNSYLKLRRDEFDALPDSSSSRKGWRNRPPIKDVAEIAAYLHQFSFSELTDIVKSLVENGVRTEDNIAGSSANLLVDTMDEAELEHIINFSDPTAKLVSKTRTGAQRVYNQSINSNTTKEFIPWELPNLRMQSGFRFWSKYLRSASYLFLFGNTEQ